ncbi:homeobox protein knotted-1-like 4 isoform X2 [Vicia villosa]|uniref:homeobox protein knotted-1-like 4 isoform X2 n=1 Tax=Vicia villosa TaxID=3911 RepID=UPI00273B4E6F|nr:homeobox protein knotted-1-like 4 isoform X2 [Vicia villosa]
MAFHDQNFIQLEPERREKSMDRNRSENNCETEELRENKAEILGHPLYGQLLSAHVSCLRIATPVDQLPRIDAQPQQSQRVLHKYSSIGIGNMDHKELDHFMTHYVSLLCAFKEQLQHVHVHAMEAMMPCWDLQQSLQSLTGVSSGEGTGATMSADEEEQTESNAKLYNEGSSLDGIDTLDFGPLVLTETERSLMERIKLERKHQLEQGYKEKIVDVREEIVGLRRTGKVPGHITSLLKAWWQSHSKWPYPTEEDKARLVQETGLQLKQINNWFINQRKRNASNSETDYDRHMLYVTSLNPWSWTKSARFQEMTKMKNLEICIHFHSHDSFYTDFKIFHFCHFFFILICVLFHFLKCVSFV